MASDRKVAGSNLICRSVLEQDTEPQTAPDVWLPPCMAASASACMRLVQGPETAGIGSSRDPVKGLKRLQVMDGWLDGHQGWFSNLRNELCE